MESQLIFEFTGGATIPELISFEAFENSLVQYTPRPIPADGTYEYLVDNSAFNSAANFVDAFNNKGTLRDFYIAATTGGGNEVTITARFEDPQYNFRNFSTTDPDVSFISITDAGSGGTPSPTIPSPINVISTQYENQEIYPQGTFVENNPYGSVGDETTIFINFGLDSLPNNIKFQYGWITNDTDLYNGSQDNFTLPDSYFRSIYNDDPQAFSGGVGTLDFIKPSSSQQGSAILTDNGGGSYTIEHKTIINPLARDEDLNGDTALIIPEQLNGTQSIKYVFKIEAFESVVSTTPYQTTDLTDLNGVVPNGNIAWFNEFLNGRPQRYELVSFDFENDQNILNTNGDTNATVQIRFLEGNFFSTDNLMLVIQEIPDSTNQDLTFQENLNLDKVIIKPNGSPLNGSVLQNVTANVNGFDNTLCDLTFTILSNTIQGNYNIFVTCANPLDSDVNHQALLLKTDVSGILPTEGIWNLDTPQGAPFSGFNILPQYLNSRNDIGSAFNERADWVQDKSLYVFRLVNSDTVNFNTNSFRIQYISDTTGQVFDNVTINESNLTLNTNTGNREFIGRRAFQTNLDDDWGALEVYEIPAGSQDYTFYVGMQPWEDTADLPPNDLNFRLTVNGTETLQDQTTITTVSFFEETPITPLDYGVQAGPDDIILDSITFFDSTGSVQLDGLNQQGTTLIRATFISQSGAINTDPTKLFGELGIGTSNSGQNEWRFFTSVREPESSSPWESITNAVPPLSIVTLTNIDTATVEGFINFNKLKSIFPTADGYEISARLDRNQF